jgi:hypothetical protein
MRRAARRHTGGIAVPVVRPHPLQRALAALALGAIALAPVPAHAGGATLKRAVGNLVQGPIDVGLSPITAGVVGVDNLRNIDDTLPVQIFYAVPGYLWLTGLFAASSVLRTFTGALELVPGIFLLPFDAEMDPLFDPAESGSALISQDTPVMDIRIGLDYTAAPQ